MQTVLPEKPTIIGSHVILKFFQDPHKPNCVMSKTLGKYSYVDPRYKGEMPERGEMWVGKITHESNPGNKKGAFLIEPVERLKMNDSGSYDLFKLMPGFYKRTDLGNIVVLNPVPDITGRNCIATLTFKRALPSSFYAIIVPLEKWNV